MELEKKSKGRQLGSTKSVTTIKDPILGKYYIENDEDSFNICEEGKQTPLAFCTTFVGALKSIAKRMLVDKCSTLTVREYINELNIIFRQLENKLEL